MGILLNTTCSNRRSAVNTFWQTFQGELLQAMVIQNIITSLFQQQHHRSSRSLLNQILYLLVLQLNANMQPSSTYIRRRLETRVISPTRDHEMPLFDICVPQLGPDHRAFSKATPRPPTSSSRRLVTSSLNSRRSLLFLASEFCSA